MMSSQCIGHRNINHSNRYGFFLHQCGNRKGRFVSVILYAIWVTLVVNEKNRCNSISYVIEL